MSLGPHDLATDPREAWDTLIVGSLFAGIGGFDLGLERAGMRTIWQVEEKPYRRAVLARHFPDAERFADVREVGAHNLAPVDVICGGFPCQDISLAGGGEGIDGARSSLWTEFARIIGELGPRYALVENVPALTSRGLDRVLRDLAALGYDAEWDCLPASAFGAPHIRDRIWLVAYPNSDGVRLISERDQREGWEVRAALGGITVAAHDGQGGPLAYPNGQRFQGGDAEPGARRLPEPGRGGPDVADAPRDAKARARAGPSGQRGGAPLADPEIEPIGPRLGPRGSSGLGRGRSGNRGSAGNGADAESIGRRPSQPRGPDRARQGAPEFPPSGGTRGGPGEGATHWESEPDVGRVADGIPARVDRLSSLGDALVPQAAEWLGWRVRAHEARAEDEAAVIASMVAEVDAATNEAFILGPGP